MNKYTVFLSWDDEASKWYALNDDIPIILEDASLDTLIGRPGSIPKNQFAGERR
jgi:hypothetical protein